MVQGIQDTPVIDPAQDGGTPTPVVVTVPVPDPAEELRRENETLKKQVADKDRFITDIQSEKQTLEARWQQTHQKQEQSLNDDVSKEASRILETAQLDPVKAGEDLGRLIQGATSKAQQEVLRNLEPLINQQSYISQIKKDNADLIDLGLEPAITLRANQLIQSGKPFNDAVNTAVSEARVKVDKLKSHTPIVPTPPPASGVGERGANRQPEPTPIAPEQTDSDEIRETKERRRKMGL